MCSYRCSRLSCKHNGEVFVVGTKTKRQCELICLANLNRKASLKSSTKRIKAILSEADQLTPRIKVARKSKSTLMDNTQTDCDIPGPSTLYPPPPLCHVSSASSFIRERFDNQPSCPVPPLVSVGPHVSMTYSLSASVLYAPVVTVPDAMVKYQDFWLYFIRGNISRCNGCGKRDLRK